MDLDSCREGEHLDCFPFGDCHVSRNQWFIPCHQIYF
ncbi:hypothetical protein OIU74_021488 [Salix koriyanagi]|uniref:Uncharacterized protein n=1 Tax=Salix koriyanagi TaxID=2511006 RepID=A0A9Q0WJN4_9ROSI|nr:hypothetical protein OIU74_021488 [Salix koriyanagi]